MGVVSQNRDGLSLTLRAALSSYLRHLEGLLGQTSVAVTVKNAHLAPNNLPAFSRF